MTRTNRMRTTHKTLAAVCATYLQQTVLKHNGSPKPEFLKLGSVEPQCSVKVCQGSEIRKCVMEKEFIEGPKFVCTN
jgi:hypothetical protein